MAGISVLAAVIVFGGAATAPKLLAGWSPKLESSKTGQHVTVVFYAAPAQ